MTECELEEEELLNFSDEDEDETEHGDKAEGTKKEKNDAKTSDKNIYSSSFRDYSLKPEITRAIADCGFEEPSQG